MEAEDATDIRDSATVVPEQNEVAQRLVQEGIVDDPFPSPWNKVSSHTWPLTVGIFGSVGSPGPEGSPGPIDSPQDNIIRHRGI